MTVQPTQPTLRQYSPITWAFERVFRSLQFLPPQLVLRPWDADKQLPDKTRAAQRSVKVEGYVLACIAVEAALGGLYLFAGMSPWWVRIAASLRIVDVVQASVNVSVFDQLRRRHAVTSIRRSLVLTFGSFLELIFSFGLLYVTLLDKLSGGSGWPDAFYFSVVTQLTIGYGDIHPLGIAKGLVAIQGLAGLGLIVVVLGRVVGTFSQFDEILKP